MNVNSLLVVAALSCAACREPPRHGAPPAAVAPPVAPASPAAVPAPSKTTEPDTALCAGRARCRSERQRSCAAPSTLQVVDVRIEHAPDAAADDDAAHCDRREYWLLGSRQPLLLLADCAEQWGPDSAAPADTLLDGERLRVTYEEHSANDVCETLQATLSLRGPSVVSQQRRRGTYEKRACRRQALIEALPLGDGSAARPLLTLHQ